MQIIGQPYRDRIHGGGESNLPARRRQKVFDNCKGFMVDGLSTMSEMMTVDDIPPSLLAELGKRAPEWDVLSILDQGLSRIERMSPEEREALKRASAEESS
jgi:hypothetical protein